MRYAECHLPPQQGDRGGPHGPLSVGSRCFWRQRCLKWVSLRAHTIRLMKAPYPIGFDVGY